MRIKVETNGVWRETTFDELVAMREHELGLMSRNFNDWLADRTPKQASDKEQG